MKKFLPLILLGAGLLMAFNKPIMGLISPASLDIQISKPPALMSCIYKVYANSDALNGKYSLFKMVIKNTSSVAAKNVDVSYSVTNYIDNAVAEKVPLIQPGQTVVVNCYPNFPDKIVEKTTESKETVKITVKGTNIKTREESFSLPLKGRNDFMYNFMPADEIRTSGDYFENMPLISCLVTPNDPVIKYLNQQIQQKVLKGDLTNTNSEQEGIRFMQGIYYTTLLSDMVYGGTSGVPVKISEVESIVQTIRLPREVITGKAGLCIELSLLYASVMAAAGLDAVVYLVPGHAYPGFKMNGHYYAIESTAIGGEGIGGRKGPQDAYQMGMKKLQEDWSHFGVDGSYQAIHINMAVKEGAVAMELKDDADLKKKIDEFFNKSDHSNAQIGSNNQTGMVSDGGGNSGGGNDNSGGNTGGAGDVGGGVSVPSGYRMYQGAVSFAYPSSWSTVPADAYRMPQCTKVIAHRSKAAYLEVYNFSGYSNPEQAIQTIQQHVSQFGYSLQYQQAGQSGGFTVYRGQTSAQGLALNWIAAFKQTGSGLAGVAAGSLSNTGNTYQQTITNIMNTVH